MAQYDGVGKLLKGVAVYRKRDPVGNVEAEFADLCKLPVQLLPPKGITISTSRTLEIIQD